MQFSTIQIPRDKDSINYYLEEYKAFRLLALKTTPLAFGSTYERELAFTDEAWYNRLANPKATTFITTESGRIVCTLTTIGPLPCTIEELSPTGNPWIPTGAGTSDRPLPLHYSFNAVFTLPEVRGQGVAKRLVEYVIKTGLKDAAETDQEYTASIVAYGDNTAARALYEKCGFISVKEEYMPGTTRLAILMKFSASSNKSASTESSS